MDAQQQSPGSEGAAPSTSGRSPTALVSAAAAAAAAQLLAVAKKSYPGSSHTSETI